MIDDFAKEYLHSDLRAMRETMLWKLDGLCEYDIRRPLTSTGTNLLGLVKHLAIWESRYFGEVFERPFPELLPRWDDAGERGADMWATEHETREEITDRYRRVWEHSDATITALAIDSPGYVPWWPRPDVKLFNILVHMLTETSRHAGHADILREQVDGSTGTTAQHATLRHDAAFWEAQRAKIERAAKAAEIPMPVPKPDLTRLLTDGGPYPFPLDGFEARIRVLPGVPLSLPSGKVIAVEPFMAGGEDVDEMAFTERVEPGTYPVVLSEIDLIDARGEVSDTRVAAARLVIRDEPVARWELAHTAGQDPAELDDDEYFGFSVDGGLGCFVDAETYRAVAEEEDFGDRVFNTMYPRFGETTDSGVVPSSITLAVGDEPHAVVCYSSGFGDGVYATWIGFTAAGDVACFLTDFETF